MSTRRKTSTEESDNSPSFEKSLSDLESLIEAMEHEQLPLEDLVASYEKGSALLSHCESILKAARKRIELITLRNQPETAPVPASSHDNPESPTADEPTPEDDFDDDHDDIRLF